MAEFGVEHGPEPPPPLLLSTNTTHWSVSSRLGSRHTMGIMPELEQSQSPFKATPRAERITAAY